MHLPINLERFNSYLLITTSSLKYVIYEILTLKP